MDLCDGQYSSEYTRIQPSPSAQDLIVWGPWGFWIGVRARAQCFLSCVQVSGPKSKQVPVCVSNFDLKNEITLIILLI